MLFLLSDKNSSIKKGWIFLLLTAGLFLSVEKLPGSVSYLGLFGLAEERPNYLLGAGSLILLLFCAVFLVRFLEDLRHSKRLTGGLSLQHLQEFPWRRICALLAIGCSLTGVDERWLHGVFAALLLSWAQRGLSNASLNQGLWDFRLVWLAYLVTQFVRAPDPTLGGLSATVVGLAIIWQPNPRLSFAASFFHAPSSPVVHLDRQLWLARLERIVLLSMILIDAQFVSSLDEYCLARIFHIFVLHRFCEPQLREEDPVVGPERRVWPNWHFYHRAFGPGAGNCVPLQSYAYTPQYRFPSIEAFLAALLLAFTVFSHKVADPAPEVLYERLTHNVRMAVVGDHLSLFKVSREPGLERLFEEFDLPIVEVQNGPENSLLSCVVLLTLTCGLYFRWGGSFLRLWGVYDRNPWNGGYLFCRSVLVALAFSLWMGWFWYPLGPVLLAPACLMWPIREPFLLGEETIKMYIGPGHCEEAVLEKFEELRGHLSEQIGFPFPRIKILKNPSMAHYSLKIFAPGLSIARAIWMPCKYPRDSLVAQAIPAFVIDHLDLFVTRARVERVFDSAAEEYEDLVRLVRARYDLATLHEVVRQILANGFSLEDKAVWLPAMIEFEGTPSEVAPHVVMALRRDSTNSSAKSATVGAIHESGLSSIFYR